MTRGRRTPRSSRRTRTNRGTENAMGADDELARLISAAAEPLDVSLPSPSLEGVLGRAAGSWLVLVGEASHGTAEFYRVRAALTRALIERGAIRFVAIEADWPDAGRLDAFVRDIEHTGRATELRAFARFPSWMWRNTEVLAFVD